MDHSAAADKGLKMKIKRTKPGTKSVEAKHEIVKSDLPTASSSSSSGTGSKSSSSGEPKGFPSVAPSQKDLKDKFSGDGKETDNGGGVDPAAGKNKATKRASSHKKVKVGTGTSLTPSVGSPLGKKEGSTPDSKLGTSTSTVVANSGSANSSKESLSNALAQLNPAVQASAFVKTSATATIKLPSQTSLLGHDLLGGVGASSASASAGVTSNARSPTLNYGHASASGGSPTKGDKGRMSPCVTTVATANSDKLGSSNCASFVKKARIVLSNDKVRSIM
jgi:hypothetical protein